MRRTDSLLQRIGKAAAVGVYLLALGAMDVSTAIGQLPPPMRRYGRARINGVGAPDGVAVSVTVNGAPVAQDTTETVGGEPGWYGTPEHLEIPGEGGDQVRYYVDGVGATGNPREWKSGTMRQDLDILQAWLAARLSHPETVGTERYFDIEAGVTNTGQALALDVTATISVTEGAELGPGEPMTKSVASGILTGGTVSVTWSLRCTETGPITVTVSPSGVDAISVEPIPDYGRFPATGMITGAKRVYIPAVFRSVAP